MRLAASYWKTGDGSCRFYPSLLMPMVICVGIVSDGAKECEISFAPPLV